MPKYHIASIDQQVNKEPVDAESALKRVAKYIQKHIDPNFPDIEFIDWCNSDSDKPFRTHGNIYYWT